MTVEQLQELSENPIKFLNRCHCHEQRIKLKQKQIQHYRDIEYSITAALKDVPAFGTSPQSKIENCTISIMTIEEDIKKEIECIKKDRLLVLEAINLVDTQELRLILEAKFIHEMTGEEIANLVGYSPRWTARLKSKALKQISKKAKEAVLIHAQLAL